MKRKYLFMFFGIMLLLLCSCTHKEVKADESTAASSSEAVLAECVAEFHSEITLNQQEETVDIYYYQEPDQNYYYELVVAGNSKIIPMRDDFMPSSVSHGLSIEDVNCDGIEDILVELGIYGKMRPSDCYLCTENLDLIQVANFSELFDPRWSSVSNTVIDSGRRSEAECWINRYEIQDEQLVLIESLTWKYMNGSSPLYTEKRLIDGELTTIQEAVPESKIDLEYWYQ